MFELTKNVLREIVYSFLDETSTRPKSTKELMHEFEEEYASLDILRVPELAWINGIFVRNLEPKYDPIKPILRGMIPN